MKTMTDHLEDLQTIEDDLVDEVASQYEEIYGITACTIAMRAGGRQESITNGAVEDIKSYLGVDEEVAEALVARLFAVGILVDRLNELDEERMAVLEQMHLGAVAEG